MRYSYLLLFLLTVVTVSALSPEEEALWQDPQYVASLTNNNFLKTIKENPYLLANDDIFASIDTRLRDPNVIAYLNKDEKLLQYWGKKKGIEFDPGAGFTKYEKGYITTKGKGVLFNPEDIPGARVLNDGSVVFGSARIEEGKVAKSVADEVMVQGTVTDTRTKTRFTATGFNIALGIDTYSIRETVAITTQYGTYTVSSKNRFSVGFDGENPSVSGTNVEIVPGQDDNLFTLEKGSVILYDNERFGLDANTKISFGDELLYQESDMFAVTNTITVDKPAHFCFTECNGIDQVVPDAYAISSIEVLRNRQFGDNNPVDRLKITARDTTNIDVNLQNPEYESIYADAHRGGRITVVQHGKNVVVEEATATSHDGGYPTVEYYSEAVISPDVEGGVKVKGEDSKPLGGSTLLIPSRDVVFSQNGALMNGNVKIVEFQGMDSAISSDNILSEFNVREYHQGKSLTSIARFEPPQIDKKELFQSYLSASTALGNQPNYYVDALHLYAENQGVSLEQAFKDLVADFPPLGYSWVTESLGWDEEKSKELLDAVAADKLEKAAIGGDKAPFQSFGDGVHEALANTKLAPRHKETLIRRYIDELYDNKRGPHPNGGVEASYILHAYGENVVSFEQSKDLFRKLTKAYVQSSGGVPNDLFDRINEMEDMNPSQKNELIASIKEEERRQNQLRDEEFR